MLEIRLLGGMSVVRRASSPLRFPSQRSRVLFAYLVLNRRRHVPRDLLTGTFWPEMRDTRARRCLRTELHRVRRTVEPPGEEDRYIMVKDDTIGFVPAGPYWLDVESFEDASEAAAIAAGAGGILGAAVGERLERGVALYKGDLLEGHYDPWALSEQERLRELFLRDLELLMRHDARGGRWHEALRHARRLLRNDPLRETIHRDVMCIYYRIGDRARALRQFSRCERLLREELDVAPMRETLEQHRRIRAGAADVRGTWDDDALGPGTAAAERHGWGAPAADAFPDLHRYAQELERLAGRVRREIEALDGPLPEPPEEAQPRTMRGG